MLNVYLLGTAGQFPRPNRYLSSAFIQSERCGILIDCGEGTQIALSHASVSCKKIDYICITHYHADHVGGLAGVLLAIHNQGRTDPLTIIGPAGLHDVYQNSVYLIRKLAFEVRLLEIGAPNFSVDFGGGRIMPFKLYHTVPCYGYNVEIIRRPKFLAGRAEKMGVPLNLWSAINNGESIFVDGKVYEPSLFYGKPRKGIKVSYCTDTRPNGPGVDVAKDVAGADLLICEAMYSKETRTETAWETRHMFMWEAAELAKKACVRCVWLTHFSKSNFAPDTELKDLRSIMPNLFIGRDGMSTELFYDNDGERDADYTRLEEELVMDDVGASVSDVIANL